MNLNLKNNFGFAFGLTAIIYSALLAYLDFFGIGLLSDDYLNIHDALYSTFTQKFSGKLPFTNELHFRPLYYLTLQIIEAIRSFAGFGYDNFVLYRIEGLILFLLLSFISGKIVLSQTKNYKLAYLCSLSVLLFPSNIHNICWTAARIDLLCGIFYLLTVYWSCKFLNDENGKSSNIILSSASLLLALFSKETAIMLPFIVIILLYFSYEWKQFSSARKLYITHFTIILIYFLLRIFVMQSSLSNTLFLYQSNPIANIPGVFAKSIIALTIPTDFLTLSYWLQFRNPELMIYLAIFYTSLFYFLFYLFRADTTKFIMQFFSLVPALVIPYMLIGYIRPQMILIPFIIVLITLFNSYHNRMKFSLKINERIILALFTATILYWTFWSYKTFDEWKSAFVLSKNSMEKLLNTQITNERYTIIVGNPGRLKQSLLFDKMTGAYNFWKNKSFAVKDTINDIVQSGAIDEESLLAELKVNKISHTEFEISTTGKTQFLYMEGFDAERLRAGFKNDYMSVEFSEFNFMNKATKMKLKIISPDADCYLSSGLNYTKLNE